MPAPRMLTHNGMTMSVTAWSRHLGISRTALDTRLNRANCSIKDALSRPINTTQRGTRLGDGCLRPDGYIAVSVDGKQKLEHVVIAERAIGKPLPPGAQVHHIDGNRSNNSQSNLVICPDGAYHQLLHLRQEALDATGNPNQRRCWFCNSFSLPTGMVLRKGASSFLHLACERLLRNRTRANRKERSQCQVHPL